MTKKSEAFKTREGVKQGGVLSPYLFNFFINEMLTQCADLKVGAMIAGINFSIIAYCDDIVLLSPSEKQAQMLVNVCEEYAETWKIDFNASKSASITFRKKNLNFNSEFMMAGSSIP